MTALADTGAQRSLDAAAMMRLAPIVLLLGGAAGSCRAAPAAGAPREAAAATARKYQVGAFYYGPWHVDPTNEKLHGKNWSEYRWHRPRGAPRAAMQRRDQTLEGRR